MADGIGQVGAMGGLVKMAGAMSSRQMGAAKGFQQALEAAKGKQGQVDSVSQEKQKKIHDAAAGLVAHALILPMLKQIRQSSLNKKGLFAPGNGEKAFGPEFDMQIADRIARSPRMTLTESVAKRLTAREDRTTQANTKGLDVHG